MSSAEPSGANLADLAELRRAKTLLATGLAPRIRPARLVPGTRFGDYQLVEEIGSGATCHVYRAHHAGVHPTVALKIMNIEGATDLDVQRFHNGAKAAAVLDHPNIVPVFHVGENDERPFFIMKLIEGGPLTGAIARFQQSPVRAARLLAKIARAVHHAHARRIFHRDLKPANILIDAEDEPHVADFGLAKWLDQPAITQQSRHVMGTPQYMSPEQARGRSHDLTCATDIFSMGAIFYELLTGQVPYEGLEFAALLNALTSSAPVRSPRELRPGLGRNFENVCLRCLEKDPAKRYRSAEELANDLDKACGGSAIPAPVSPVVRSARWARRHPRLSASLAGTLLAAVTVFGLWRIDREDQRSELETNAFMATAQAGIVQFQLHEFADQLEQSARDPGIKALLAPATVLRNPPDLRTRMGNLDSIFVIGIDGRIRAQWPAPANYIWQRDYTFRDYFQGARRLYRSGLPGAFVAPAFRSESHDQLAFALSVPVRDADGTELGMVVTTLNASSFFGAVRMENTRQNGRITTALLGPRGSDRARRRSVPSTASELTYVVHPGLDIGAEYSLVHPGPSVLAAAFGPAAPPGKQFAMHFVPPLQVSSHRDPIPGFGGTWLAAFAPVGETGFVVMVETKEDNLFRRTRALAERFRVPLGIALAVFGVGGAIVAGRRRRYILSRKSIVRCQASAVAAAL